MNNKLWTDEFLESKRLIADKPADDIVAEIFAGKDGHKRLFYNDVMKLAQHLYDYGHLLLVENSVTKKQWDKRPKDLADYYAPIEQPEWVDERKLAVANQLWEENTLPALAVLYAASLPYCYAQPKAIPVLYATEKLRTERYITQRIYETGLMLDAVMDKDGLSVVKDLKFHQDNVETNPPKKYIWGKGFLVARNVRILHASMRYLLLNPGKIEIESKTRLTHEFTGNKNPFDTNFNGLPINQHDMAYVILTFGYVIPKGLEDYGVRIDKEEKEAFLHLWKIIGHVMGVQEDLLTDKWEEAEILFNKIKKGEGPSDGGKDLTWHLGKFMGDYLPPFLGLSQTMPSVIIRDAVGAETAKYIFSEKKGLKDYFFRTVWLFFKIILRIYFLIRHFIFKRSRVLHAFVGETFHTAGEEIIKSWSTAYHRQAFSVPASSGVLDASGMPKEIRCYRYKLRKWRHKIFNTLALGIMCWFVAFAILPIGIGINVLVSSRRLTENLPAYVLATLFTLFFAQVILKVWLKQVYESKPTSPPPDSFK